MLDPTINPPQALVAVACGLVASAMHLCTVFGSEKPVPPRRQLLAHSVSTFLVGVATLLLLDWLPHVDVTIPQALVAAGVVGGTLGPTGIRWLFSGLLLGLQRVLPWYKPPSGGPDA